MNYNAIYESYAKYENLIDKICGIYKTLITLFAFVQVHQAFIYLWFYLEVEYKLNQKICFKGKNITIKRLLKKLNWQTYSSNNIIEQIRQVAYLDPPIIIVVHNIFHIDSLYNYRF